MRMRNRRRFSRLHGFLPRDRRIPGWRLLRGRGSFGMPVAMRARVATTVPGVAVILTDFYAFEFAAPEALPNQLFDRINQLCIPRGSQHEGMTLAAGSSGAADAMHVIVCVERHIEIEDV